MYFIKSILFLIFFIFIFSCDDKSSGSNFGTLEGTVYDGETFDVVENVEISTNPPSSVVKTNHSGTFKITDIVPGTYYIKAQKTGYNVKNISANILTNKLNKVEIIIFKGNDTTGTGENNFDSLSFDNQLVAFYKFNNNLNCNNNSILDLTGNGINFVANRKGIASSAISFSGNKNSFAISTKNSNYNLDEFTYACWLKPNINFGTSYNNTIDIISRWGNWGYNQQSFALCIDDDGRIKGMTYSFINSDAGNPANYSYFETDKYLISTNWAHIAMTYSNNILKIYYNGNSVFTKDVVKPQFSNIYGLILGKRYETTQPSFYSGAMDELRIYRIALSEEEIKSIYNLTN